jgi:UDP-galactopyranose mutase
MTNILELSEQEIGRRQSLQELRQMGINPYPAAEYPVTAWSTDIINDFVDLPVIGKDEEGNDLPKTIISREYSSEWKPGDEPYYPVNDERNSALYSRYKALADKERNVLFGGRLGEYRYYDMDQVIAAALDAADKELN